MLLRQRTCELPLNYPDADEQVAEFWSVTGWQNHNPLPRRWWTCCIISWSNSNRWIIHGVCVETKRCLMAAGQAPVTLRWRRACRGFMTQAAVCAGHQLLICVAFHIWRGKSHNFTVLGNPHEVHNRGILLTKNKTRLFSPALSATGDFGIP